MDLARQRRVLEGQFEAGDMPGHGEAILEGVVDGLSAKEIGAELGLSESAVKNRLSRMRKRFKAKLAALGMLTLMMVVAVLFAAPFGGVAKQDVTPATGRRGARSAEPPPTETPSSDAAHEASARCDAGGVGRCWGDLEEARKLNPAGDEGAGGPRRARSAPRRPSTSRSAARGEAAPVTSVILTKGEARKNRTPERATKSGPRELT